jgi:hypothetical protein
LYCTATQNIKDVERKNVKYSKKSERQILYSASPKLNRPDDDAAVFFTLADDDGASKSSSSIAYDEAAVEDPNGCCADAKNVERGAAEALFDDEDDNDDDEFTAPDAVGDVDEWFVGDDRNESTS